MVRRLAEPDTDNHVVALRGNGPGSSTRSRAYSIPVELIRVGAWRRRSSLDDRESSSTTSSSSRPLTCAGLIRPPRPSKSRTTVASRAEVTNRASTLAPGSSTRRSTSHAVARSNVTPGRSGVAHNRAGGGAG